jgi:diaminopimelate epimerase
LRQSWARTIEGVDGIAFLKGHGTANDFVVLPDLDGELELTPELVVALCDRRRGIGADGVLRVVRSRAEPAAATIDAPWFMDYRNADGSISETCGNGLRVFARYLVQAGLAEPGEIRIGTRGGVVRAWHAGPTDDVTVDMGASEVSVGSFASVGGHTFAGLQVSMGNPHLVCVTHTDVDDLDLSTAPDVDQQHFPQGANVEFVNVVGERHARMRVSERGVGETLSCGSGACAVAAALAVRDHVHDGEYIVDVPGGRLRVTLDAGSGHLLLSGPAELVAEGVWWRG